MINRRSILTGFAGLLAAPAIIKCSSSLMPVKAFGQIPEPDVVWVRDRAITNPYLGLAQMKVECAPVAFDSPLIETTRFDKYVAAEFIPAGAVVCVGHDGLARQHRQLSPGVRIVGVATGSSAPDATAFSRELAKGLLRRWEHVNE